MSNRQTAADRVGAPSFGGRSRRGQMISDVMGDPLPPETPKVPTSEISYNPDNPRDEIGDVSELRDSMTEVGQIVAITVATVDAYLADRPERRDDLEEGAKYVVVDGNCRLKAAREAGLPEIKVILGNEFASTDESLLEAAFIANAQRKGLTELEEAQALKRLVDHYGSQHKAAKRLTMSQPLISQKLSLLELSPELQADLATGQRLVSHVRNLSTLPHEQQREEADRRARVDAEKKQQRAAAKKAAKAAPKGDNSVITPGTEPTEEAMDLAGDNSVITPDTGMTGPSPVMPDSDTIPEPRTDPSAQAVPDGSASEERALRKVPYDEPGPLAMLLDAKVQNNDHFFDLVRFLNEKAIRRDPVRYAEMVRSIEQLAAEAS
ncbi:MULTISPECIES: ParB/RepB/Spo0J family partition protein [Streptomyces]|uniref:ParB/RepB/Spo0J family partition protein n=1 Tax=Streptomyces TaxID=1883 RepID=UPI0023DD58F0|nr:ParB/RepB/Spo0J family partition protein [Streptomyces sp. FXJ1.172]WEP00672.1 ParB/RepB/Spo0J family partition protein [Streptomyces sp. FXJ1.172]